MSPQEFANKIREKYPNAYQDIDDITLSQKVIEKYPVYAPQVNFDITPETAEVKPAGFFERTVGAEVKETGERLAETFEKAEGIPEKALAVGTVPLRAAGATARAGGRMIAEPISGLIKMASDVLSENKFVQDLAMGKFGTGVLAGAEDIGSKISSGLEAIKEKVSPEVYQSLADTAELAMWAVGGKPAAEAGKVGLREGVKAGVRAAEAGIRAGEVAVAGVKRLPKIAIEKSKQTVLNLGKRIYGAEGEKVIASLEKSYAEIPLPKNLLRSEAETGKSFSQFMAEKPYIPIKTKNMKYDTYATAQTLRQEVGAEAKALSSLLENRIERVSLDTIRQNVKNNVSKTTMGQERVSALSYVDNEFDLFVSQYKILDGTIDLTTANKIKQAMWDRSPFNPTASRMDRLSSDIDYKIGQAFKNNIEDAIPDVDIKALNSQLGDYYNAIQTLEKLHGGAAPRGRIGIEFARLAGAGIGSQGGFVGSIVGYMAAGKVAQLLASPEITTAFKRYIAQELRTARPKIADEVASILKKQSEEQISRLKLTEGAIPLGAKTGKSSVEAVPAEYAEIEKLLLGEGAVPLKAPVSESSVKAIQAEKGLVGQDPATGKFIKTYKGEIK